MGIEGRGLGAGGERGWSVHTTFWGCFGGRFILLFVLFIIWAVSLGVVRGRSTMGYDVDYDIPKVLLVVMFLVWLAMRLYGRRFLDYPTMLQRAYPAAPELVDAAVCRFLASRCWDFERLTQEAGPFRSRGFRYKVYTREKEFMDITLEALEGGGTVLRFFYSFDTEARRTDIQAAIDVAVESPDQLDPADARWLFGPVPDVGASRAWKVRRARFPAFSLWGSILLGLATVALLAVAIILVEPFTWPLLIISSFGLIASMLLEFYAMMAWERRLYEGHDHRSERTYPITPERVDIAVGLLLASRRAEFERAEEKGGFLKPRGFRYKVYKVNDVSMVITVRPREGGGTELRLFCDIKNEARRTSLHAAIDAAVESPYELDLSGAMELEEPPELHVFED